MARTKPFNLFVYGTLMSPWVFRAVMGRRLVSRRRDADGTDSFFARQAVLNGYKKISPDNTYLYAVPDPHGRIRGYLIGPLPPECLAPLRRYEGKNYVRRTLSVHTADADEQAVVFLGNMEELQHAFGYEFRDHFKQEVLLGEKIDAALVEAQRQRLNSDDSPARRALAELHGDTIRSLQRRHFEAGGISDYAIRHSLLDAPLPDYSRIRGDPEAAALAPNYLAMVVRQVIFNELEENIYHDFRYELDHMGLADTHYERTVSSLAALRIINSDPHIEQHVQRCLAELSFDDNELMDFVQWGVTAAEAVYDQQHAKAELDFLAQHMSPGCTPLGAELEFSNIGHSVIRDPAGEVLRDRSYDGFLYFYDFALDVLTGKLGGHIDDHHEKRRSRPRRGFFEVALGSLSIEANISKPVTDDPWLLNQIIHEARRFYRISPHSLHVSLQMPPRQRLARNRPLPLAVLKCLFAIAGDPVPTPDGRIVISRLVEDEIFSDEPGPHMLFSEIVRRHSTEGEDSHALLRTLPGGRYVQQFKFLRLSPMLNYELLALALKGLQISLRPGSFLIANQYAKQPRLRRLAEDLRSWARQVQPLSSVEIETFTAAIYDGLTTEKRGKPAHSGAYISWSINQLRKLLTEFNEMLAGRGPEPREAPIPPADAAEAL